MKEIKAFIRTSKVETVLDGLHEIGVDALTIIDVMALGRGMLDPKHYKYSIECVDRYSRIAKLEIVCADDDLEDIIEVVRSRAYSAQSDDGLVSGSSRECDICTSGTYFRSANCTSSECHQHRNRAGDTQRFDVYLPRLHHGAF